MSFKTLNINNEYRTFRTDIVREFYIPVLEISVLYKRAVGFFSSTALIEISKGITELVKNNGKILLIVSPQLQEGDIEAINKGYQERKKIIEKTIINSIQEYENYFDKERLNLLAHLIEQNKLDIKIAFTLKNNAIGIYHEKVGLVYDKHNNIIAFTGSLNETETAFSYNYETMDVFKSWEGDMERIIKKEEAFNRLWNNSELNIEVMEFPEVAKEKLLSYKTNSINIDIDTEQFLSKKSHKYFNKPQIKMPDFLELYNYQLEAIENWKNNNYCGIFDMATGTGKTFTALAAIVKLLENNKNKKLAVFIVCPFQHLVEQWVEDILKFNIKPIIGYSASTQKNWKILLENAVRDQKLNVKNKSFFCFVCTNATFSSKYVQSQIQKIKSDALLIADEAHNFGATYLKQLLNENFKYRLALSATIERHNDREGTEKLFSYFGKKCIEYTLERPINEKKLTRYKYYPIIITLTETELSKYLELTYEIGKCLMIDKNGKKKLNAKGKILALKRARLVAGAEEKIKKLEEYIKAYISDKHILVYCGAAKTLSENQDYTPVDEEDIRQIDCVTNLLGNKLNMKVSQFTSKEDMREREILKKEFDNGENLQVLIAIKCLDEGVNIPNIKIAFILASTTNPKEYIQRRGRVLRLTDIKKCA